MVCEYTPQGFPLRAWLTGRAEAAAAALTSGDNGHGTLFASPSGGWWSYSNFRARRFNPAATDAGWARVTWRGPVRRRIAGRWVTVQAQRWDWQHPPHALRRHYACTARDLWGWTGAELCVNGGWADQAFVLTRYYGSTEETYRRALAKQAGQLTAGKGW